MTLEEYFSTEPWGAKQEMARYLGITQNYLSMLITGKRRPGSAMTLSIHRATQGLVSAHELRPDLFAADAEIM